MIPIAVALLAAAAYARGGEEATASFRRLPTGQCTEVRLRALPEGARLSEKVRKRLGYSATKTLDLELSTQLRRNAAAAVEFRLYTPQGHLYQTLRVPVPAIAGKVRKRKPPPPPTAVARLPLSGSTIMVHTLYGRWRVEPYVIGQVRPCAPPTQFKITR